MQIITHKIKIIKKIKKKQIYNFYAIKIESNNTKFVLISFECSKSGVGVGGGEEPLARGPNSAHQLIFYLAPN